MKLLICTQKVDRNDPILGFFHRWIEEFAKHCEKVTVICLFEGEHALPKNVSVHSLGKERGASRLVYLSRFFSLIWQKRNEYDTVFVHMNPEYIVLGGLLWRTLGKRVGLWYAHGSVTLPLRIASLCSHILFTSTDRGLGLKTQKKCVVGQGIDTELFSFTKREQYNQLRLITVGRIAPSKNIETLLHACVLLTEKNIPFHLTIVGDATTDAERRYKNEMLDLVRKHNLAGVVQCMGAVAQRELPLHLAQADIFIQDSATKSLDKALLEAILSGLVVVSSNASYVALAKEHTPQYCFGAKDTQALTAVLERLATLSPLKREQSMHAFRKVVGERHGVKTLISAIVALYS